MSGANYFWCPVCDSKALYDHTDEPSEVEGLTVLHDECLEKLKAETGAEALRAEADTLERAVPSEDAMPTMFVVPAHIWLRSRADSRLRDAALRSTEKGTNQ